MRGARDILVLNFPCSESIANNMQESSDEEKYLACPSNRRPPHYSSSFPVASLQNNSQIRKAYLLGLP